MLREFYTPFSATLEQARVAMPEIQMGNEPIGEDCPKCGNPLVTKYGRYGKFIGCSTFPTCRHTEPWLEYIGVPCPVCGNELVERKTRKGRTFYGCSTYPECEWTSWKRPLATPCPVCGGLLVVQNKERAQCTVCEEQVRLDSLPEAAVERLIASPLIRGLKVHPVGDRFRIDEPVRRYRFEIEHRNRNVPSPGP